MISKHKFPLVGIMMLAAGNSSRMGRPKQLLPIGDKSLIQLLVGEACLSRAQKITVVTGAYHQAISTELTSYPISVVSNIHWKRGMGSSIHLGLSSLLHHSPQLDAIIICVSDQPYLKAQHLNQLIDTHINSKKSIVASLYQKSMGTPVLFAKKHFHDLASLHESSGARPLLQRLAHLVATTPFPEGLIDLDRWEDYLKYLEEKKGL